MASLLYKIGKAGNNTELARSWYLCKLQCYSTSYNVILQHFYVFLCVLSWFRILFSISVISYWRRNRFEFKIISPASSLGLTCFRPWSRKQFRAIRSQNSKDQLRHHLAFFSLRLNFFSLFLCLFLLKVFKLATFQAECNWVTHNLTKVNVGHIWNPFFYQLFIGFHIL